MLTHLYNVQQVNEPLQASGFQPAKWVHQSISLTGFLCVCVRIKGDDPRTWGYSLWFKSCAHMQCSPLEEKLLGLDVGGGVLIA